MFYNLNLKNYNMVINNFKDLFAWLLSDLLWISKDEIIKDIALPPDSKMWDLAFPVFQLAKILKKAPPMIALELVAKLKSEYFEKFDAVWPYINAFIDKKEFTKNLFHKKQENIVKNHKVLIEHLWANPNKPLHIWQARNVCIWDSVVNIFRYLWYQVHAINYWDDSWVNVWYNILWHLEYGYPFDTDKKYDHYCGDIYTQVRNKEDDDPEFKRKLSEILLKIEKWEDKDILAFHQEYTRKCTICQFQSCWRMNIYFDLVNWETDILHIKFFDEAISKLKQKWFVYVAQEWDPKWCLIVDMSTLEDFSKEDKKYQILVKSDGVATYVGKDIAYAMRKLWYLEKDFHYRFFVDQPNGKNIITTNSESSDIDSSEFHNYNIAICVVDNRQSFAQKIVKGSLSLLGFLAEDKQYLPLAYWVVRITPNSLIEFGYELTDEEKAQKKLPFSSRKWWFVTIDDTLDRMHNKVYNETKIRNPEKDELWLNETAEKIVVWAFRFFLIKWDINKDIVFDINDVLDMEWETGAYVLYTYARISSVISKFWKELDVQDIDYEVLSNHLNFQLIKKMDELEYVITTAKDNLCPDMVAKYVYEMSRMFNNYYSSSRILDWDDRQINSRLVMLTNYQKVMKCSMNLIWMIEVERM